MLMWNHLGEILMSAAGLPVSAGSQREPTNFSPVAVGSFDPASVPDAWRTLISS
jgi:hypothetical protein